ncbi:uncharacterized protein METZ01_LOCUS270967, partial [marine metagenome]
MFDHILKTDFNRKRNSRGSKKNGVLMAWNDKNNQNPWGRNNQTPPELEEVIKDFKNKFKSTFGGSSSGGGSTGGSGVTKTARGGLKYLLILAVLVWLLSGIYIVDPAERGV